MAQRENPAAGNCGARDTVCLAANNSPNSPKHIRSQAQFERRVTESTYVLWRSSQLMGRALDDLERRVDAIEAHYGKFSKGSLNYLAEIEERLRWLEKTALLAELEREH